MKSSVHTLNLSPSTRKAETRTQATTTETLQVTQTGDSLQITIKATTPRRLPKTCVYSNDLTADELWKPHSHTETTIVKDTLQNYQFVSALSTYTESESEESSSGSFCYATERRISMLSGVLEESYELFLSEREVYCPTCQGNVCTFVQYKAQEASFWSRILCRECMGSYVALHRCKVCEMMVSQFSEVLA